jgi:DNA invertase Pin-like site-specific DNA recombinase
VSSFKRRRVLLPDGTYGYRVVRPDWESILTALRRGECNALACADIDRATRDPRILEDLIDAVELYGIYVVSMTGNIPTRLSQFFVMTTTELTIWTVNTARARAARAYLGEALNFHRVPI